MYRLETALIKLASCPLLTSWYASRETIEIEQWSLFEAWADFGRTFLEAGMISVQVRTYLTRYIATLGDPHHSRNVFTHYILEAMQLVIYKSWDPHTLYISLESVLKKKITCFNYYGTKSFGVFFSGFLLQTQKYLVLHIYSKIKMIGLSLSNDQRIFFSIQTRGTLRTYVTPLRFKAPIPRSFTSW